MHGLKLIKYSNPAYSIRHEPLSPLLEIWLMQQFGVRMFMYIENNNFTASIRRGTQKTYLIANINLNPRLEVVKDLFKVPCPGSSQVTGITVRLERGT